MALYAKNSGGVDFEPLSAGTHHAVCYGIVDLGTQPSNSPQFKASRKVAFLWEIPAERIEFTKDGQKHNLPRGISGMWSLTLASKGKLRPMLESWRGRPFTEAELEGFDLQNVLGANCLLSVVHNTKGDKTYANVASVAPLMKTMSKIQPENPKLFFSLDEQGDKIEIDPEVPEWLANKIKQSAEYLREANPGHQEPTDGERANQMTPAEEKEDIPF